MMMRGKVNYVISSVLIEADMTLGFGVHIQRRIWLDGVKPAEGDALAKKAMHCLVVLIGGKRIFAEIPDNETGRITAKVYRDLSDEALANFPDDMKAKILVDSQEKTVIRVNNYLNLLSRTGYPIDDVRSRILISKDQSDEK